MGKSSLPCAPPVHSGEYMVNQKMFSLWYFAKEPHIENVFKITNRADIYIRRLLVTLLLSKDLTDQNTPANFCQILSYYHS